jgi:hypothetical protein
MAGFDIEGLGERIFEEVIEGRICYSRSNSILSDINEETFV